MYIYSHCYCIVNIVFLPCSPSKFYNFTQLPNIQERNNDTILQKSKCSNWIKMLSAWIHVVWNIFIVSFKTTTVMNARSGQYTNA